MNNIQDAINEVSSLTAWQENILSVANRLVNDDIETREDLALELVEAAHEMHERATALFKEFNKAKSPLHSVQG